MGPRDAFFPVRDDFFAPLSLPDARLAQLRVDAKQALAKASPGCRAFRHAAKDAYLADAPPWKLLASHEQLRAMRRGHDVLPSTELLHVTGSVDAHYQAVARFFQTSSRFDEVAAQRQLLDCVVDAAVLYVVPPRPGASFAYEAIKWVACKPPSAQFRMDLCYYEAVGVARFSSGRPYAFRVVVPAIFPEVPDLFDAAKALRVLHKSVMFVFPSERNARGSDLFVTIQNDFKGNRVPKAAYREYLVNLDRLDFFINCKRLLANRPTRSKSQVACGVCSKSFSLIRSKHQCEACSTTVCRKCLRDYKSSKACEVCVALFQQEADNEQMIPVLGGSEHSSSRTRSDRSGSDWWQRPSNDEKDQPGSSSIDTSAVTEVSSSSLYELGSLPSSFDISRKGSTYSFRSSYASESASFAENDALDSGRGFHAELDTSQMSRVSRASDRQYSRSQYANPASTSLAIASSIQEQEELLQQLTLAVKSSRS